MATERKKLPGIQLYFDYRSQLEMLNNEQIGKLILALLDYGEKMQQPIFEDRDLDMIFAGLKPRIDADREKYADKCEKAKRAAEEREKKRSEQDDLFRKMLENQSPP